MTIDDSITYHGFSESIDAIMNENDYIILVINTAVSRVYGGGYSFIQGVSEVDSANIQVLSSTFADIISYDGSIFNFDYIVNGSVIIWNSDFYNTTSMY